MIGWSIEFSDVIIEEGIQGQSVVKLQSLLMHW
jgi:hypothetical protein